MTITTNIGQLQRQNSAGPYWEVTISFLSDGNPDEIQPYKNALLQHLKKIFPSTKDIARKVDINDNNDTISLDISGYINERRYDEIQRQIKSFENDFVDISKGSTESSVTDTGNRAGRVVDSDIAKQLGAVLNLATLNAKLEEKQVSDAEAVVLPKAPEPKTVTKPSAPNLAVEELKQKKLLEEKKIQEKDSLPLDEVTTKLPVAPETVPASAAPAETPSLSAKAAGEIPILSRAAEEGKDQIELITPSKAAELTVTPASSLVKPPDVPVVLNKPVDAGNPGSIPTPVHGASVSGNFDPLTIPAALTRVTHNAIQSAPFEKNKFITEAKNVIGANPRNVLTAKWNGDDSSCELFKNNPGASLDKICTLDIKNSGCDMHVEPGAKDEDVDSAAKVYISGLVAASSSDSTIKLTFGAEGDLEQTKSLAISMFRELRDKGREYEIICKDTTMKAELEGLKKGSSPEKSPLRI